MKKKLEWSKAKTNIFEDKIKLLKGQKPAEKRRLVQIMQATNTNPITTISKSKEEEIN